MLAIGDLHEFALVERLAARLPRSPRQRNARHMADAELIELPGGDHLAVTIDGLHEEYALGVLRDPELVGWANVVHSLSDLAAAGASPLGVLVSFTLPRGADEAWTEGLTAGTAAALEAHGTFCLGGDTSFADEASFQCVGVGLVKGDAYLTRAGARVGDRVFVTGPVGLGNLLGLARSADPAMWEQVQPLYRPRAPFDLVAATRPMLRAAIDTSDGLLAGLDLLMRTNQLGLRFRHREELYHPALVEASRRLGTPLWIGGAFGMGEYELLLVVDGARVEDFLAASRGLGRSVLEVACFEAEPRLVMVDGADERVVDSTRLLNLFAESQDTGAYVKALLAFDAALRGG